MNYSKIPETFVFLQSLATCVRIIVVVKLNFMEAIKTGKGTVVHIVIFVYSFRACKVRHRTRLGTREHTGKRSVRSRKIQFHAITGRTVSCRPSFSKTEAPLDELLWIALSIGGKRRRRDALFPHRVGYCAMRRYQRGPSTVPETTTTFVYVLLPLFRCPAKSKRHCST